MKPLTPAQAADRLGITPNSVYAAIKRGALIAERQTPSRLVIPVESVEAYRQHRDRERPGPDQCSKCGGPRTWEDHAYCAACNRAYTIKRLQDPAAREAKRESDRESDRRRRGRPARAPRRYA
jgi:hypothetical protein